MLPTEGNRVLQGICNALDRLSFYEYPLAIFIYFKTFPSRCQRGLKVLDRLKKTHFSGSRILCSFDLVRLANTFLPKKSQPPNLQYLEVLEDYPRGRHTPVEADYSPGLLQWYQVFYLSPVVLLPTG